ncbi:hypothetical protein M9458_031954, partial [Cirrhinus mrigala]
LTVSDSDGLTDTSTATVRALTGSSPCLSTTSPCGVTTAQMTTPLQATSGLSIPAA